MERIERHALLGASACLAGLAALWAITFHAAPVRRLDDGALHGFSAVTRPRLTEVMEAMTSLADPFAYLLLAAAIILIALARRRYMTALAIPVILGGANLTAQLLKHALADERLSAFLTPQDQITAASWPSGHAAAAMALGLCLVLAAPPRLRAAAAFLGAGYAVGVGYAVVYLEWHFPSDVLAGYLVAGVWALLGVAALTALRAGRATESEPEPRRRAFGAVAIGLAAAVLPVLGLLSVLALAGHDRAAISQHDLRALALYAGGIALVGWLVTLGVALELRPRRAAIRATADTLEAT